MEEAERVRRMRNPMERQLATELAGVMSESINKSWNGEKALEEKERERRTTDWEGQWRAKNNARQVSLMVRESSSNKVRYISIALKTKLLMFL